MINKTKYISFVNKLKLTDDYRDANDDATHFMPLRYGLWENINFYRLDETDYRDSQWYD